MSHEVENMLYVGETPWHGLGNKLDVAPATVKEALAAAGLDWQVELQQLSLADGRKVDRFATVRKSDNSVLGTVGPGYRVLQNEAAFSFFDPFLASKAATIETAGSLRKGARVWMLAKIDRPDSVIVAKADDRVAKFLLLAQGHDGSLAVHVGLTPVRVVCQNTLSAAIPAKGASKAERSASGIMRIRHSANAGEMLATVQESIERADQDFERAASFFRELAGVRLRSTAKLRTYIDAVFPSRKRGERQTTAQVVAAQKGMKVAELEETSSKIADDITQILESGGRNGDLNLVGVKGTAWAAYNAVTEYLTWDRGRSNDTRLDNLWLGGEHNRRAIEAAKAVFLDS